MRPAIELFGAPWCEACANVKKLIVGTNPAGHGVTFTYVDVGEDPAYAMRKIPVVFVGDEKMEGPTLSEVSAAIDRLYDVISPSAKQPDTPTTQPPAPLTPAEDMAPPVEGPLPKDNRWLVGGVFAVLGFVGYTTLVSR